MTPNKEGIAMHYLFWIVELFSMLMTAFIGACFYVGGFILALIFIFLRWIYRSVKGARA